MLFRTVSQTQTEQIRDVARWMLFSTVYRLDREQNLQLFGTVSHDETEQPKDSGMGRPTRASVYQAMDEAIRELQERFGGLPTPAEAEDIWSDLWHEEAHNSTALEGNTLVLREVAKLLEEGKAVGAKPLRDYMEVRGYGDAAK